MLSNTAVSSPKDGDHLIAATFLCAPLPEQQDSTTSASVEYAERASRILEANATTNTTGPLFHIRVKDIQPLTLQHCHIFEQEDHCNSKIATTTTAATTTTSLSSSLYVFIISCAADGSINRVVRKLMQAWKKNIEQNQKGTNSKDDAIKQQQQQQPMYAVVLLGHARCDNSAKQTSDLIYSAGRRFEKSLSLNPTCCCWTKRLETQVELEGPEDQFDPWVLALRQHNSK